MRRKEAVGRLIELSDQDTAAVEDIRPEILKGLPGRAHKHSVFKSELCSNKDIRKISKSFPLSSSLMLRMGFSELSHVTLQRRREGLIKATSMILKMPLYKPTERVTATDAIFSLTAPNLMSCPRAEANFVSAANQINGKNKKRTHREIKVYYDGQTGMPIALEKTREQKTALLLAPCKTADDLTLPTGTIVTVDVEGSPNAPIVTHTRNSDRTSLKAAAVEGNFPILPLRLSAWIFDDPTSRAIFATSGRIENGVEENIIYYDQARATMLERNSIADLQDAASFLLDLTGVERAA